MIEFKKINLNTMVEQIEKEVEKKFSSMSGYKQVRSILEGKATVTAEPEEGDKTVDTNTLVEDAGAVFSGDNKPELLMTKVLEGFSGMLNVKTDFITKDIDNKKKDIADRFEKNKAIFENRRSAIVHKVKNEDALHTGRLVAYDGDPIEGANVILHGIDRDSVKIIAKAVTDANGEYIIKMDEKLVKDVPKKVALTFDSPAGENIAKKKAFSLTKGKVIVVDMKATEDKKEIVSHLIKDAEERKNIAIIEMTELKRSEADLNNLHFKTVKTGDFIKSGMDGIKNMFIKKDSQ